MAEPGETRPLIVPIFIPNQGCPHRCIFCQQEKITDHSSRPLSPEKVKRTIEQATASKGFELRRVREIAFYGGTFTNLPIGNMKELLGAAFPFLKRGFFNGIRVSTRPDSLDEKRLNLLARYGVRTVELGVQSMDNRVLDQSRRGHHVEDTVRAVRLLKEQGFKVGIQLMPGLPGDSRAIFRRTVKKVIGLGPDMVRLYPAIVIRGTGLAVLYARGQYTPLTLDEAVDTCCESCSGFEKQGIPVIRIGLMSSPSLIEGDEIMAGPWHGAFGFLVRSRMHYKNIEGILPRRGEAQSIRLRVPRREIPLVRGYQNIGLRHIEEKTGATVEGVLADDAVPPGQIKIERIS